MRIFIDTNVVLDFLQERQPFVEDAAKIFARIDCKEDKGYVAATTMTNIYYILRKVLGSTAAEKALTQILNNLQICTVDRSILEQAVALGFTDFEDAVQYACALAYGVDVIVTRDPSGFTGSEIAVKSPKALVAELGK
jgi:predicted nucleic acid-binding protein